MKKGLILLILSSVLTQTAWAHNEHDNKPHQQIKQDIRKLKRKNQQLNERVTSLEELIAELQAELNTLSESVAQTNDSDVVASSTYACIITTKMNGAYFGKGSTKIEARAAAIEKCGEKANEFWCKSAEVECEAE